jgi:4-diphosphocytidyl-2-C-methyl-D-erythritol kinase
MKILSSMIRFPNCKINLGLHILEKLPDGYHSLETIFYPLSLSDILEINPSDSATTRLTITGIEIQGQPTENLCYKAWDLLNQEFGIPTVEMHLHKIIPTGAGLGGGSSDAAFTLSMINELFNIGISSENLFSLALRLGMDCPYFLLNTPALGTGKGEKLTPVPINLKGIHIVVAKPDIHISTAEAYSGVIPRLRDKSQPKLMAQPIGNWKQSLVNDFEEPVFLKYPEIAGIKEKLYEKGALYASMSGSGSAVYGLFNEKVDMSAYFNDCFVWQGSL